MFYLVFSIAVSLYFTISMEALADYLPRIRK